VNERHCCIVPLLDKRPTGIQNVMRNEVGDIRIPRAERYGGQ